MVIRNGSGILGICMWLISMASKLRGDMAMMYYQVIIEEIFSFRIVDYGRVGRG